jgi:hypothetical protein
MAIYNFRDYPDLKSRQKLASEKGTVFFTGSAETPGRIMAMAGNSGRKRRLNEAEIKDTLAFWRFWGFRKQNRGEKK